MPEVSPVQRQLLEMRLHNYRRNREQCHEAEREKFDELVRQTERELAAADAAAASRRPAPYPFDATMPLHCPSHLS